MPSEILINQDRLFRCCLASVSEYSQKFPARSGDIFQCPYCSENMEVVEEGENLCWQWLKTTEKQEK